MKQVVVGTLASGLLLLASACGGVEAPGVEGAAEEVGSVGQGISLGSSLGKPLYSASTCGLNNGVTLGITRNCTFNGQTYETGQVVASGVRCSAKYNGYCIGGVFAGSACVASGECYATCDNGNWE